MTPSTKILKKKEKKKTPFLFVAFRWIHLSKRKKLPQNIRSKLCPGLSFLYPFLALHRCTQPRAWFLSCFVKWKTPKQKALMFLFCCATPIVNPFPFLRERGIDYTCHCHIPLHWKQMVLNFSLTCLPRQGYCV